MCLRDIIHNTYILTYYYYIKYSIWRSHHTRDVSDVLHVRCVAELHYSHVNFQTVYWAQSASEVDRRLLIYHATVYIYIPRWRINTIT